MLLDFDNKTREELIDFLKAHCTEYELCNMQYDKELKDFSKKELLITIDNLFFE